MSRVSRLPPLHELESEWQSGEVMRWFFQRRARIWLLQLRGEIGGAVLNSIRVGNEEQLLGGPCPLVLPAYPDSNYSIAQKRWQIGPVDMPTLEVGMVLRIEIHDFRGALRPIGLQAPR